jgi:anti-sigma B factor antagonist
MSNTTLQISTEHLKRVTLVTVSGRIDSSNAHELDAALSQAIEGGHSSIVVNLSGVSYMSSAGLRALVSALRESKKKGGDVRLSAPSERVSDVLNLAGLSTGSSPLFTLFEDDTTAVGSF